MRRNAARLLILAAFLATAIGLSHFGVTVWPHLVALVVLVLLLLINTRLFHINALNRSHIRPTLEQVPQRRAYTLQQLAGRNHSIGPGQAEIFALAVVAPTQLRQRLVEQLEPGQRTLRQKVTIDGTIPRRLLKRADIRPMSQLPRQLIRAGAADSVTNEAIHYSGETDDDRGPLDSAPLGRSRAETQMRPMVQEVPFPVVTPRKGLLHDKFAIYGSDGEYVQTLSYSQYLQLAAGVLRMLLLQAHNSKENLPPAAAFVEHRALVELLRRGTPLPPEPASKPRWWSHRKKSAKPAAAPPSDDERDEEQRIEQLRERGARALLGELETASREDYLDIKKALAKWEVEELLIGLNDSKSLKLAAELVRKLRTNYAIVAYLPCDERGSFVVTYEQTIVPQLTFAEGKRANSIGKLLGTLKSGLRMLLGSRPVVLTVSLRNACTATSYHATILSADGLYLRDQQIIDKDKVLQTERAADAPTRPYVRVQPRRGQAYAHFYARYFPETPDDLQAPKLRLAFYEVPPGALFRSAVAAASSFLLVWLVGVFISLGQDPGTDAPAFLLVFPAVAAAWLGLESAGGHLLEGSLASRVSLILTTIFSITASGLYMGNKVLEKLPLGDGRRSGWLLKLGYSLPDGLSVLGVRNIAWAVLTLGAMANAVFVGYRCIVRTWEYGYLSSLPVKQGDAVEIA